MNRNLLDVPANPKRPAPAGKGDRNDLDEYIQALGLHLVDLEIEIENSGNKKEAAKRKLIRIQKSINDLKSAKTSMIESDVTSMSEFKLVKEQLAMDEFNFKLEVALIKELETKQSLFTKELEQVKKEIVKMENRFANLGKVLQIR